jgi:hypothetical protein
MRRTRTLAGLTGAAVAALALTSASLGVTQAAPSNTTLPSISGSARDGSNLTASHGGWTGSPTSYAYAWLRCDSQGGNCATIGGATSRIYTVQTADVGSHLRVRVTATNGSGSGDATSRPTDVVKPTGSAPKNTSPPTISGNPLEGATLTVGPGSWSGTPSPHFTYQWQRCIGTGGGCSDIPGATGTTYVAGSADVAHTLRVNVTASNTNGASVATTAETALIAPAKSTQGAAIAVSQVTLPDLLTIDRVSFNPLALTSRNLFTGRFHVSDTRGFSISGALVYAIGLPYGWVRTAPEVTTDSTGWATITFRPTASLPLRPGAIVFFVRARKPGDSLLSGVSARRLVQETIR